MRTDSENISVRLSSPGLFTRCFIETILFRSQVSFKFNSFGSSLRRSPAGAIKNNQNGFRKAKISKYFNFERIQKGPRRTQKAKRRNEFTKIRLFCVSIQLVRSSDPPLGTSKLEDRWSIKIQKGFKS